MKASDALGKQVVFVKFIVSFRSLCFFLFARFRFAYIIVCFASMRNKRKNAFFRIETKFFSLFWLPFASTANEQRTLV
jgi:hypothetical protein